MAERDFQTRATKLKPHRFTLDGEEFFAAPTAPAGALLDVIKARSAAAAETATDQAKVDAALAIVGFFDTVLDEDSLDRLQKRMRDPKRPVNFDDLGDVFTWLTEEAYAGDRPTSPRSDSPAGLPSTAATWSAASPTEVIDVPSTSTPTSS